MKAEDIYFKAIKVKDRLPDINQRVFFFDSKYKGQFMIEYVPDEKIEIKKGKFIEMKDCKKCIYNILSNFDYWLEIEIKL